MERPGRPRSVQTRTDRIMTGCGNAYITISTDEHFPFEVIGKLGKSGGCAAAFFESITRIVTEARVYGVPIERIVKHLKGIQCPASGGVHISCPEALARVLEKEGEEEG